MKKCDKCEMMHKKYLEHHEKHHNKHHEKHQEHKDHHKKHHAKESSREKSKVNKVMHEWKEGKLHSGSKKGPVVRNEKQAVAIALSEARKMSKKKK
jgi:Family of unknown function (DUF6496)